MQKDRFWHVVIALTGIAVLVLFALFAYLPQPDTSQTERDLRGEDYFSVRTDQSISDRYLYPKQVVESADPTFPVQPDEQLFTATLALPYAPASHLIDRDLWVARWGTLSFAERGIELGTERSSFIVFRGGREWENIHFEATVDWGTGAVFGLAARILDDRNFVECAYSYDGRYARIYYVEDGRIHDIATSPELPTSDYASAKSVRHAIEVEGQQVRCFIEGERVLQGTISNMPHRGSIGFETWDTVGASRPHAVTALSVDSI